MTIGAHFNSALKQISNPAIGICVSSLISSIWSASKPLHSLDRLIVASFEAYSVHECLCSSCTTYIELYFKSANLTYPNHNKFNMKIHKIAWIHALSNEDSIKGGILNHMGIETLFQPEIYLDYVNINDDRIKVLLAVIVPIFHNNGMIFRWENVHILMHITVSSCIHYLLSLPYTTYMCTLYIPMSLYIYVLCALFIHRCIVHVAAQTYPTFSLQNARCIPWYVCAGVEV